MQEERAAGEMAVPGHKLHCLWQDLLPQLRGVWRPWPRQPARALPVFTSLHSLDVPSISLTQLLSREDRDCGWSQGQCLLATKG